MSEINNEMVTESEAKRRLFEATQIPDIPVDSRSLGDVPKNISTSSLNGMTNIRRTQRPAQTHAEAVDGIDQGKIEVEERRLKRMTRQLGPIYDILKDPLVADVFRNPDGRIWVDRVGRGTEELHYTMSEHTVMALIGNVAEFMHQTVNENNPKVEGVLATDNSRFSAIIPPATNGGAMFSIRKRAVLVRTFDDYIDDGSLSAEQAAFIRKRIRCRDNFLVVGATGSGKALDVNTIIMTPYGTKRMGDIVVGDRVLGKDGKATNVLGVYPQGKKKAYRITFEDGVSAVCCDEHLWSITDVNGTSVIPLSEIRKRRLAGIKLSIPMAEPFVFEEKTTLLPMDPGALGRIIAAGRHRYEKVDELGSPRSTGGILTALPFATWTGFFERIPREYLYASVEVREKIFQGLIDASYPINNRTIFKFRAQTEDLANDVLFLTRSLGYKPVFTRSSEGTEFTVSVYHVDEGKSASRLISWIDEVEPREMVCIAVDAQDHLFVIEHGIVTHNTTFSNTILKEISAVATPNERFLIMEDTPELQCFAPQTCMLLSTPGLETEGLLKAIMRHRPTCICVGELRGAEAHTLVKSWNTGHKGGITTIHAESARKALDRLEDLIAEANIIPSKRKIADSVNTIIVINNDAKGKRHIREVVRVRDANQDGYIFGETV